MGRHKNRNPVRDEVIGDLKFIGCFFAVFFLLIAVVHAKEGDGHSQSPLHAWFDSLQSGKGRCCADADGDVVLDSDWESRNGHYRVRLGSKWTDVPDDAVITVPNLDGRTIVWPIWINGEETVRCFIPGAGA
jgi:hypothetical protein